MQPPLNDNDIRSIVNRINQHTPTESPLPNVNLLCLTLIKLTKNLEQGLLEARHCDNDLKFLDVFNQYTERAAKLTARIYPHDSAIVRELPE